MRYRYPKVKIVGDVAYSVVSAICNKAASRKSVTWCDDRLLTADRCRK